MIKIHLKRLLRQQKLSINEFSRLTDIRTSTISAYCNRNVKRMNVKDLAKMCDVLGCMLSDLLEYIPNPNKYK